MCDSNKVLDFINKIKINYEQNVYDLGEALKLDFYRFKDMTGVSTNDDTNFDLNKIFQIQRYLIAEVCNIHKGEKDSVNEKLLRENIHVKKIKSSLIDGKRACSIYTFNNTNYEYYIIGDIHSDTISLIKMLEETDFFDCMVKKDKKRWIFLGDYVDRGKAHVKVLEIILVLKYLFPNNVYLLQGNHDDGLLIEDKVKLKLRKKDFEVDEDYFLLYLQKYANIDVVKDYLKLFESLCNIAIINNENKSILLVHGGIPRPSQDIKEYYKYINSISDLTNIDIIDHLDRTIVSNMLWSDPYSGEGELRVNTGRFSFTYEHFNSFKQRLGFDILIRGHEAEEKGYKRFFDDSLFTVFSSGIVLEDGKNINNETAYTAITPRIMHITSDEMMYLLNINDMDDKIVI
ncbi:metallophosphoesterase family protein [Clostridiaceae bacterium M8S5]|nr:metallophosphoesterase family protein [Clostridiaceae bacterium M8S5]